MAVHYKFKSTLNFETITFDGLHISVADLKREIIQQKRLGKIIDFDLQITNAQTKEEYKDDNHLIPKNTTLIISRIPVAHPNKKIWDPQQDNGIPTVHPSKAENLGMDLFKMQGSEEEKIHAMMMQSTADYDPKTYQRIKGQTQFGDVPASYRCNKCKKGGHWIKNCTFTSGKDPFEMKRNTGIPRSFRGKSDVLTEPDKANYQSPAGEKQEIPEDLLCGICRNIFVDAVMIPCCGSSFCDDCVRNSLLESEDSECPDCKEKNCSPGSLIPNRFLRNSVNVFKNESGYKIIPFQIVNKGMSSGQKENELTQEVTDSTTSEIELKKSPPSNKLDEQTNNGNTLPINKKNNNLDLEYEDDDKQKGNKNSNNVNLITESNTNVDLPSVLQTMPAEKRHDFNAEYKLDLESKQMLFVKHDNTKAQTERSLLPTPISNHQKYASINLNEQREKALCNTDHSHRISLYKPTYMAMARCPSMVHMPPYNNGYNNVPHRLPLSFGHYQTQPVHQLNTSYMAPGNLSTNPSQTFQSTNLASIYQGVAAKVGTGLIDDPLEAFNRIMKEKEKQKVDRRRSPDQHRSRSPIRSRHRFKSPLYSRGSSREIITKEKSARSRERKREYSYDRRHSRLTRNSSTGSTSPTDKKKRYANKCTPSPKIANKVGLKDKSLSNLVGGSKFDIVEPPPPGFEFLPIDNLIDSNIKKNTKPEYQDTYKSSLDQNLILKKINKITDLKIEKSCPRSLTPPKKTNSTNLNQIEDIDIPTKSTKSAEVRDKNIDESLNTQSQNIINSQEHAELNTIAGKENNTEINIHSKERKKKKKDKTDRKKIKKDKKVKKDKQKKELLDYKQLHSEKICNNNINSNVTEENKNKYYSKTERISSCIDFDTVHKKESVLNTEAVNNDSKSKIQSSKLFETNDVQISKWELEDSYLSESCAKIVPSKIQEQTEITSDVIRKAENAIFAKAIKAIRPVEFKVVIDSKINIKDTLHSFKNDQKDCSLSPKSNTKSVKERLGNKIVCEKNYSLERTKKKENSVKHINDDRYKYNFKRISSRNKEKDKRLIPERQFINDHRKSNEHEFIHSKQKDYNSNSSQKHKLHLKDKSKLKVNKCDKEILDSDRNDYANLKSGELRTLPSIASKPCRPDNPFRKFDENISSSNKLLSFAEVSAPNGDHIEYKKRKDKKIKKIKSLRRDSSTDSTKSEKSKYTTEEKKYKALKKKKKSRK